MFCAYTRPRYQVSFTEPLVLWYCINVGFEGGLNYIGELA